MIICQTNDSENRPLGYTRTRRDFEADVVSGADGEVRACWRSYVDECWNVVDGVEFDTATTARNDAASTSPTARGWLSCTVQYLSLIHI